MPSKPKKRKPKKPRSQVALAAIRAPARIFADKKKEQAEKLRRSKVRADELEDDSQS